MRAEVVALLVTSAARGPLGFAPATVLILVCFAGSVVYLSEDTVFIGEVLLPTVATVRMLGLAVRPSTSLERGTMTEGTTAPGAMFSAATTRSCSKSASLACLRITRRKCRSEDDRGVRQGVSILPTPAWTVAARCRPPVTRVVRQGVWAMAESMGREAETEPVELPGVVARLRLAMVCCMTLGENEI